MVSDRRHMYIYVHIYIYMCYFLCARHIWPKVPARCHLSNHCRSSLLPLPPIFLSCGKNAATHTYCRGSTHGHCSTDPGCQVANQYGWPFPYGSLYRAEPHAPLLGGGAEEFNNWNSPWWRPSPVDAEPSDMVSCLEQSESWAKMTNGEFSLLNWFLNSYSGQSCSYTFLHVWMFHKVFFNKYFPKQRLRWRVLYIFS